MFVWENELEEKIYDDLKLVVMREQDRRTALGNQFAGLQTGWWRMHEWQSIHGAPN